MAIPGSVVNIGNLVTPGGDPGPGGTAGVQGINAYTLSTADFTVPAYGATVQISVQDTSWMVVGETLYVANAGGGGTSGTLKVTAKSGSLLTLLNPSPPGPVGDMFKSVYDTNNNSIVDAAESVPWTGVSSKPLASTSASGLLKQVSGNTTDFIDGTNNPQPLQPVIWSARLRSFNAVGNPSFEIDQRHCGVLQTNPASGTLYQDRWAVNKAGTLTVNVQQNTGALVFPPGTLYLISPAQSLIALGTQQASLGATDFLNISQTLEGIQVREIAYDVTSLSIFLSCSVAPMTFGIVISDSPVTKSLCKLCSVTTTGWTLIQLPNLPAGNFATLPGAGGATLKICFATGSTYMPPANDTWQTGDFRGALGQSNWANNSPGVNISIGFVQWEPGPLCTTPIDKPFSQNYNECLRYYYKTLSYGTPPTAAAAKLAGGWMCSPILTGTVQVWSTDIFPVPMAKAPTLTTFSYDNGTVGSASFRSAQGDTTVAAQVITEKKVAYWVTGTAAPAGASTIIYHYVADTGW